MPQFSDIRDQDHAHELLRLAAAKNRLPHAAIFYGQKGVGKTTTAFALAQFLNCEQPSVSDSCSDCRSCRRFARLAHPDLHWIFPMAGSEKGDKRIEHIRDTVKRRVAPGIHGLSYPGAASIAIGRDDDTRAGSVGELRRQAGYRPVEAKVKVFVISQAERMTREAANSLLKVLEEPPPNNLVILTAERKGELLDTIVSRCQSVRFRDLSETQIADLLVERGGEWDEKGTHTPVPREAAVLAAALAGGSLTRAQDLVVNDVVEIRNEALRFLSLRPGDPDFHKAVADLDKNLGFVSGEDGKPKGLKSDRRSIELVLDFGILWLGDLLRAATGSSLPLINQDRKAEIQEQAARFSVEEIRRRSTVLDDARSALRGNVYRPLVLYPLLHGLSQEKTAT